MKLKKFSIILSAIVLLLLITIVQVKAQGVPCGDPDVDCPIDTPIILFAVVILFLAAKKITQADGIKKMPVKEA